MFLWFPVFIGCFLVVDPFAWVGCHVANRFVVREIGVVFQSREDEGRNFAMEPCAACLAGAEVKLRANECCAAFAKS